MTHSTNREVILSTIKTAIVIPLFFFIIYLCIFFFKEQYSIEMTKLIALGGIGFLLFNLTSMVFGIDRVFIRSLVALFAIIAVTSTIYIVLGMALIVVVMSLWTWFFTERWTKKTFALSLLGEFIVIYGIIELAILFL